MKSVRTTGFDTARKMTRWFAKSAGPILQPDLSRNSFLRYAMAIAVSVVWVVLRWYLWRGSDNSFPYASMFLPIAFSAYYGGFGPGLASVLVTLTLGNYFWVGAPFSLQIPHMASLVSQLAFSVTGLIICTLGEANRRMLAQGGNEADIQRILQDHLRANEERLTIAENLVSAGVWEWNVKTNQVYWSDGYRRLIDYPLGEEASYEKGMAAIHSDDRERVHHWTQELFRQRLHNWVLEYRVQTVMGRIRWVTGNARIYYDDQGNPTRMVGVNVDVTARKAAEQAIANNEARMRLLLQYARVGGWEWNPGKRTSVWSDQLYDVLGLDRSLPSTIDTWLGHIHPEDRAYMRDLVHRLLKSSEDQFQYEYRIIGSDGIERYIHERGMVVREGNGHDNRLVGVSFDITNRRREETCPVHQNVG